MLRTGFFNTLGVEHEAHRNRMGHLATSQLFFYSYSAPARSVKVWSGTVAGPPSRPLLPGDRRLQVQALPEPISGDTAYATDIFFTGALDIFSKGRLHQFRHQ